MDTSRPSLRKTRVLKCLIVQALSYFRHKFSFDKSRSWNVEPAIKKHLIQEMINIIR